MRAVGSKLFITTKASDEGPRAEYKEVGGTSDSRLSKLKLRFPSPFEGLCAQSEFIPTQISIINSSP